MFDSSKSKLARAQKLIDELFGEFQTFGKSASVEFDVQHVNQHTRLVVRVNGVLPAHLANIVGDAIHNARASLDLLACECLRMSTGSDKKGGFAFGETEEDFAKEFKNKQLHKCHPGIADYLKNGPRPFKSGNYLLWALHHMDIGDKHKDINPVANATTLRNIELYDPVANNRIKYSSLALHQGVAEFQAATITGNASFSATGPHDIHLQFGKGDYLAGQDVFQTLVAFKGIAGEIIESCERILTNSSA